MWTEKFRLNDLREFDTIIRNIMNKEKAKYSLQMNASLYLPRNKGGRGLRNFESLYKKIKIKSVMNILCTTDPRVRCVKEFDCLRMNKGKGSMVNDAIRYAEEDFNISFKSSEDGFEVKMINGNEDNTVTKIPAVKQMLKNEEMKNLVKEVESSKWQGVILKSRYNDSTITNTAFTWLTKWKSCPVDTINELQSIHLQTIPTLTFQKCRGETNIQAATCRMCKSGNESVKHLLSSCSYFLPSAIKRRHDKTLQWILFNFLFKHKLVEKCPPWYSNITIKPYYENKTTKLFWDIPEYSGSEDEEGDRVLRPDGKIVFNEKKKIYILEMSVPWTDNHDEKFKEKESKYVDIVQRLKINNPGYNVKQLTFIIDGLGAYSNELVLSLKNLFNEKEIKPILYGMQ